MKKLVGLLLAGLAMISMTFMSCSAETDSPSAPAFEVTYGNKLGEAESIEVDLLEDDDVSIYLYSKYFDKLDVVEASIDEDELEVELGKQNPTKKSVQVKMNDFLDVIPGVGKYTVSLSIACPGVLKENEPHLLEVEVNVGPEFNVVADEIEVDLLKGKAPTVTLYSKYYNSLGIVGGLIEETEDDLEEFNPVGIPNSGNESVKFRLSDFLDYVTEAGEYNVVLYVACPGVIKDVFVVPVTVYATNGDQPIVYTPKIETDLPSTAKVGATLTVEATITRGDIAYQWYKDGSAIPGATTASYEVTEKGSYYVVVSNEKDSSKSVTSATTSVSEQDVDITLEVTEQPKALVIANLDKNSSQVLTAKAKTTDGEAITAQWFKDGTSVSAVQNATGSIEATLKPNGFGQYVCKFTSGDETVSSNVVEVKEAPIAQGLVIDGIMDGVTVNVGDEIKISPRSDVPCSYTYQWWAHGETSGGNWEIEAATSDTYTVTDIEYEKGDVEYGIYCVVTFQSTQTGETLKRQTVLAKFVKPQPGDPEVPTFTTDLTKPTIDCYVGENVTLEVAASVKDGGKVTYQWYKNGAPIEGATSASYKVDTSAAGEAKYVAVAINTLNGKTKEKQSATTVVKVAAKLDDYGSLNGGDESKDIPGFDFN